MRAPLKVMSFEGRTTDGAGSPAPRRLLTGTSPGHRGMGVLVIGSGARSLAVCRTPAETLG